MASANPEVDGSATVVDPKAKSADSETVLAVDVLTKYKTAGQICQKVLATLTTLCIPGTKVVELCEKGDKLLEDEISKVFRSKNITKGFSHPVSISGSAFVSSYSPLKSDIVEAATELQVDEPVKIQLGAHIDGYGVMACDTIIAVPKERPDSEKLTGRSADLILAAHYATEVLLRLLLPVGLPPGSENKILSKPASASKIRALLDRVVRSYGCNLVQGSTCWQLPRNEAEGNKRLALTTIENAPKTDGQALLSETWVIEIAVSLGSGKVKQSDLRSTIHRKSGISYSLKRPTSRKIFNEIQKKFGSYPFSLRQLEGELDAKSGVVECVRSGVLKKYDILVDKDMSPVAKLVTTIGFTKNGIIHLSGPPALDPSRYETENKITDEEVLSILALPVSKSAGKNKGNQKNKQKKQKSRRSATATSSIPAGATASEETNAIAGSGTEADAEDGDSASDSATESSSVAPNPAHK